MENTPSIPPVSVSVVLELVKNLEISYNDISIASRRQISKTTVFRICNSKLPEISEEQRHLFSLGLAICIQNKVNAGRSFPLSMALTVK